jgi:hypothetical protein
MSEASAASAKKGLLVLHIAILLAASISFESLFIDRGLNLMDEGWPLHAAMEMHDGKTLYDEVFWVFPPGHVLPAWIAYALDPPGIMLARSIYAAFSVALCIALYFVARRFMPADFALLAGLMVAVAAPNSHASQLLFGYRYLVWSVLALLFFHRRLVSKDPIWLLGAGVFTAIALFFRLTPAAAVGVAIGVGCMAADRDWRRWLRDWLWYAAGIALVALPLLSYFAHGIGLEKLWIEMFVRPVEMTDLQSTPVPDLSFPGSSRDSLTIAFTAFGFRFYPALYGVFALLLVAQWWKAVRAGRSFEQSFLLAFVLWGGIYILRSLGRSDEPHLDSAIPPVTLLLAYLASLATRWPLLRYEGAGRSQALARWALCACILTGWIYLIGSDRYVGPSILRGETPSESVKEEILLKKGRATIFDAQIPIIQEHAKPGDTILVMFHAPLLYVLAERHSPGYHDLIMPGTFRSPEEEQAFLQRLEASPPALVVWPRLNFDRMPSRGIRETAPQIGRWVQRNYQLADDFWYLIFLPKQPH